MKAALALLLTVSIPASAIAQDAPLGGISPEERSSFEDTLEQADRERFRQGENTPEARRAIESYGSCAAERKPAEANRLLTMDFNSSRYRTGLRLLADEVRRNCARDSVGYGWGMRSANVLFSGAIAEALLEADATPLNARLARNASKVSRTFSPSDAIALCLARSLPDQVGALFATVPGSEEEQAAAAPLVQAAPSCAQALGIQARLELTVPGLRAIIATASYRLLANSGASPA